MSAQDHSHHRLQQQQDTAGAARSSDALPAINNSNANINHNTNSAATLPSASSSDDSLLCKWGDCRERGTSGENLYDHICERHIGRKSTNNLTLVCGWDQCNTTTVKRDHITSHVRVHVPLKPHKCAFCGKAFKRPQDLKKHVKTHADDSVLAPQGHQPHQNGGQNGGYRPGPGKVIADLQNLATTATGYYDHSGQMHPGPAAYGNPHHHAPNGYYTPQQPSSYGPVYYPVNHGGDLSQQMNYDNRKGYEVLNTFFADAKRRQIDPTSYAEVGNRLTLLQGLPIQGGGISDYVHTGPAMVSVNGHGGHGGPMAQHQYALPPMPSLRTKNDLLNVQQFLDQAQSTVYETSDSAAATVVHQPGAHYTQTADNYRQSNSPPQHLHGLSSIVSQVSSAHGTAPMRASHSSQSNSSGTPALTPASSSVSYTSGHSPASSHGMSPTSGHSSSSAPYPSLPADANGYSPHSTTAPASTLATNFDPDDRRRYSGGMLQRSADPRQYGMDGTDDYTPSPLKESMSHPDIVVHPETSSSDSPDQSSVSSPGSYSDSGNSARERAEEADRREEAWIENIRVIEALRRMVTERLENEEYEDDVAMSGTAEHSAAESSQSLYPVLRIDD